VAEVGRGVGAIEITIDEFQLKRDRDLLRLFAPKVLREVDAELRGDAQSVADAASSDVAHRAQTIHSDPTKIDTVGSYKVSVGGTSYRGGVPGTRYSGALQGNVLKIKTWARGGSILEFAGKKNPQGLTPRGATLIATLNQRYGQPGRVLWDEWDKQEPRVLAAVEATVLRAEAILTEQLGARL
jgi:hypothetical protein